MSPTRFFIIVFFSKNTQEYYFRVSLGENDFNKDMQEMLTKDDPKVSFALQDDDLTNLAKKAQKEARSLKITVVGLKRVASGQ